MDDSAQQPHRLVREAVEVGLRRSLKLMAVLLALAGPVSARWLFASAPGPFITFHYFFVQDLPVLLGLALLLVAICARRDNPRRSRGLELFLKAAERLRPWQLALATIGVCAAGVCLVFGGFALSMDEFWAQADGLVLATGAGLARIPSEWRDYAPALQPIFARITPDGWWASEYLPVNAAIQYLAGPLASPLLTGFAVLVAADLARRLLPEEPFAPIFCALLMVTSNQLLITGMTPYAMSAHLAFNLAWLWLFLRRGWRAQLAALPLPMLAIGLHQVVFFPLFAAPFLLDAWFARRRVVAVMQLLAIGAGFLFWSAYDEVLYASLGVVPVTESGGGTGTGIALLFSRFMVLLGNFSPLNIGLMALNLIRFIAWQNVLVLPLVLIAAAGFVRMSGVWRAMLGGIVLTIVVMTVILAFQGHGWGYRYLHGQLASACLLATYGYFRLPDHVRSAAPARALVGAALAVSLLLAPVRAWQAASFTTPYRLADNAISKIDADVVLVDAPQYTYAIDLVRNDPLLGNRPKRMTPQLLSDAQLVALCRNYKVEVFTDADAARFGLHKAKSLETERVLPIGCAASDR